jgi:hypothetical protein
MNGQISRGRAAKAESASVVQSDVSNAHRGRLGFDRGSKAEQGIPSTGYLVNLSRKK